MCAELRPAASYDRTEREPPAASKNARPVMRPASLKSEIAMPVPGSNPPTIGFWIAGIARLS